MIKTKNRLKGSREIPVKDVSEFSVVQQRIAEKAYELYERRGCCDGRDVEDWLEAERLVLADIEQQTKNTQRNPQKSNS